MTVSEHLNQAWSTVVAEAPQAPGRYHRRIPLSSRWPVHAGIHFPSRARILVLEAEAELASAVRLDDETRGYSVQVALDEAGRAGRLAICIQEVSQGYREIFTVFCTDILDHWVSHAAGSSPLDSLSHRLARWKRFFQHGAQPGLSREDYIGLYGELSFVEAGLNAGAVAVPLVAAWQAPLATNQDFLFGVSAVEIKTVTANDPDKVRVTNARQLDSAGLQNLFLARYAFDFRQGTGRTLPELVATLKSRLSAASPEALILFTDRLLDASFVESVPNEFDTWGFTLRQFDTFRVTDGFPRLIESDLPPGVSETAYTLNLAVAAPFKVPPTLLWSITTATYA